MGVRCAAAARMLAKCARIADIELRARKVADDDRAAVIAALASIPIEETVNGG